MVDAADSKSATCEGVGVQVPPSVLYVLAARVGGLAIATFFRGKSHPQGSTSLLFEIPTLFLRWTSVMAQTSYATTQVPRVDGARTAILISKWHREFTEAMAKKCLGVLQQAGCAQPKVHVVPGSLEIPLAAKRLVENDPSLESIIVFGVILKGDTYHFEMVKDLANSGIERVMFEYDIPIINEIIPVDTLEYVKARCADDDKNKGLEAGLAAVEIMAWRRENPKWAPGPR